MIISGIVAENWVHKPNLWRESSHKSFTVVFCTQSSVSMDLSVSFWSFCLWAFAAFVCEELQLLFASFCSFCLWAFAAFVAVSLLKNSTNNIAYRKQQWLCGSIRCINDSSCTHHIQNIVHEGYKGPFFLFSIPSKRKEFHKMGAWMISLKVLKTCCLLYYNNNNCVMKYFSV